MLNKFTEYIYVYFNMFMYYNKLFENQSKMTAVKNGIKVINSWFVK